MRSEYWYQHKLEEYFNEHYKKYDFDIEWYINPSINQWKFKIPELNAKITITCNCEGKITEIDEPIN